MQLTWGFVCVCVWFFGFCCFWKDYLKWIPYSSLPSPSGFPPSLPLSFLSIPIFLPFSFFSFSFFFLLFLFLHDCFSIELFLIFVSSLHFPSKSILLLFLNLSPLSLRNFFSFHFSLVVVPVPCPRDMNGHHRDLVTNARDRNGHHRDSVINAKSYSRANYRVVCTDCARESSLQRGVSSEQCQWLDGWEGRKV